MEGGPNRVNEEITVNSNRKSSYGVHSAHLDDDPGSWLDFTRDWLRTHDLPGDIAMLVAGPCSHHPDANHRLEFLRVGNGPTDSPA